MQRFRKVTPTATLSDPAKLDAAIKIFCGMKKLLKPSVWIKHRLKRVNAETGKRQVCLLGAYLETGDKRHAARSIMRQSLQGDHYGSVISFNDSRSTKYSDVEAFLGHCLIEADRLKKMAKKAARK